MGYRFRYRLSKKTPLGRFTVTNRKLSHSVRTPFGTFSKWLIGGGRRNRRSVSSQGNKTGPVLGCVSTVATGFLVLVVGCCGFGGLISYFSEPTKTASFSSPRPSVAVVSPAPSAEPFVPEPTTPEPVSEIEAEPVEPAEVTEPVPVVAIETEPTPDPRSPQSRTWTASNGSSTVVASLVQWNETHVQLKREYTGALVAIPLASLSRADNEYVELFRNPVKIHNDGATVLIGKVTRVLDGDTVHLHTDDGETTTIRLEGVDAPEPSQTYLANVAPLRKMLAERSPQARFRWKTRNSSNDRLRSFLKDSRLERSCIRRTV